MAGPEHHPRHWRQSRFRFYAELNDFLPPDRRFREFSFTFSGTPTLLDSVQALGAPHTEIDLLLLDGRSAGFDNRIHGGERIAVYPVFERLDISPLVRLRPAPLRDSRFILDVHLGTLTRRLRMLGFDCLYENRLTDPEIIDIALAEGRIILTRDLGILKQRRVTHGYWLRNTAPEAQLREVLNALDLWRQCRPLSRCIRCNGDLRETTRASVRDELAPETLECFVEFWRCRDCGKVYWQGSHHSRMLRKISALGIACKR